MPRAKKITNTGLKENEEKLAAARKRNRARRETVKNKQDNKKAQAHIKVVPKTKSKTSTAKKVTSTKKSKVTTNKAKPNSKTKSKPETTTKNKPKATQKIKSKKRTRKKLDILKVLMNLPRWCRFVIYVLVLIIALYSYYLFEKGQLLSTLVDFLNENFLIILPLVLVLMYSLTVFYLGFKTGRNS
ncbi:hypothetical protein [Priestia aryabhattai]